MCVGGRGVLAKGKLYYLVCVLICVRVCNCREIIVLVLYIAYPLLVHIVDEEPFFINGKLQ